MTTNKIQQAVEDLQRVLAMRKGRSGGRLHYSDQLVEAMLPIVETAVAWANCESEDSEDWDPLAAALNNAISEAEKALPCEVKR